MPFEIPDGWCWTTVEEVCSKIGSGSTPKGSNYSKEGIPFFRSQNVQNDGIVLSDIKYISDEVHQSMIGTEVVANDLLLNITGGSLGRCAVVPRDFDIGNVSQHVCILRTVLVKPEYLHCFILSSFFSKSMKITGSGREGLPKYNLEKMLLPLPPIQEQERIIIEAKQLQNNIDKIDTCNGNLVELISQTKSKILDLAIHGKLVPQDPTDEPASELLKRINPKAEIISDNGHYQKLPKGWCLCLLNDVLKEVFAGGDKPLIFSKNKSEENYIPIYANGTENKGLFGFTNKAQVYERCLTISARGTIGFTCIREVPFVPIVRLITAIPLPVINLLFLKHQIDTMLSYTEGSSIPQLTIPTIKRMLIILPPLKEQLRIVAKIEELFALLDTIKAQL